MSVLSVLVGSSYIDLPTPAYKGYKTLRNELSKADRNTLGDLIKERITLKTSIEIEWHGLTPSQKNTVLSATSANLFKLTYLNLEDDMYYSAMFYRGSDLEITGYGRFDGTSFARYDITMSLVEARD